MKKRIITCLVALFYVLLVWGMPAWADSECTDVAIHVEATATTPNPIGQYAGVADLTIGGINYSGDVIINPVGMQFSDDGTIHLELQNAFTIPGLESIMGCHDKLVLVPTEDPSIFQMNNRSYIQGETGVFIDAYGKLSAHGTMFTAIGSITMEANGRICNLTGM